MRLHWLGAAAALALFVWLACLVSGGAVPPFDSAVRESVHRCSSPPLTGLLWGITYLGSEWLLIPFTLLAASILLRRDRRRDAAMLCISVLGAEALDSILKLAFHRLRPMPFFGSAAFETYSFPSGHAMVSCCFYLTLAGLVRGGPAWRVAAALLAVVIGVSRIYLGMHYPSDVIGGLAAGVVWMEAIAITRRAR